LPAKNPKATRSSPRRRRTSAAAKPRATGSAIKKPPTSKPTRSKPELDLAAALRGAPVDDWLEEYRFHPTRKWRFDFAWPAQKVAVEVEGGVYGRGRHVRPAGFIADCEKYNTAAHDGWLVLRFVPRKGWIDEAVVMIVKALESRR
jgi:very-short-patch-repair endonuclease